MKFYEDSFKNNKERDFCFWLLFPFFNVSRKKHTLTLRAVLRCHSKKPVALSDFTLKIGDEEHWLGIKTPFYDIDTPKEKHFALIKIVIYRKDLGKYKKHNLVCLCKKHSNSIVYDGMSRSYKRRHSPLLIDRRNGNTAFFRQSIHGKLMLTVRKETVTDRLSCKIKEKTAYCLARPFSLFERKHPVFMYEKFGRYEEGASVLYEKLIDKGYKKVYFVADSQRLPCGLDGKYKKHIVPLYSFRHFFVYFRSYTFLSSEIITRAVDLYSLSFLVWKHCRRGYDKCTHVNLQHGVMYMISLSSAARSGVRKTAKEKFYKQLYIISSEKEARHFIEYGKYDASELYVTGIPKFDKAVLNENADRIVIMPTWRPWEENFVFNNPEKTTYYKFIKRIKNAVPPELAEKVIVLPHPIFNSAFRDINSTDKELSYDKILRDTKLLITDYSSISYDAFYRGCNVVFVWSELKKCLKNYGKNSKLMLTEDDAFGDVCYTDEELKKAIEKSYYEQQNPKYISNYRTIVKFNDNRNCERVIESLERDGIL